ncbi:MAG: SDR family oxidoreductase [Mariprofundaceae bacterium]|nr:SDR family oxidoreductase [Mariprofundaceae bacterium]
MSKRWLVTGASGLLGHALCQHLVSTGHEVTGVVHSHSLDVSGANEHKLDLLDGNVAADLVRKETYDVVVHCAGLTNVDACESDEEKAVQVHARVAKDLAKACKEVGGKMVYISTDHLWDGSKPMVDEAEPARPMNAYARTKLEGERRVLIQNPESLVVRTNFFGPGRSWRASLSDWIVTELSQGHVIKAFTDVYFTPIGLSRLCPTIVDLVEQGAEGVFNVVGSERISKYEFAVRLAQKLDLSGDLIEKGSVSDARLGAPRPRDMSLTTDKISDFLNKPMPTIDECFDDLKINAIT